MDIVERFIRAEVKKHPFCMLIRYPADNAESEALSLALGIEISEQDNDLVFLSFPTLEDLLAARQKVQHIEDRSHGGIIECFQKGREIK